MKKKVVIKILGVGAGIVGCGILGWIFYPIISYQINAPVLMTFLSPLVNESEVLGSNLGGDYTKASTWFPAANADFNVGSSTTYKISIPRLGIKNASVSIGGEDLSESLIQYPGTAVPGQIGNAVIFGHSVLPAFYDPSDYLAIFSTLPTLIKGDSVTIDYDGITYKYLVEEKYEVEPSDIQILSQDQSDSFITLVTCVPPGLTTRRAIIKARIVPVRSAV